LSHFRDYQLVAIEPSGGGGVDDVEGCLEELELARLEVDTLSTAFVEDGSSCLRVAHDLHQAATQAIPKPKTDDAHSVGVAE
jgi:hypothetical protein